jgi:hypothetical protein
MCPLDPQTASRHGPRQNTRHRTSSRHADRESKVLHAAAGVPVEPARAYRNGCYACHSGRKPAGDRLRHEWRRMH